MRQGNGTDLLGMNDPRSATIGVIYVSPNDDRMNVLAAILTQEKLNREHTLIVLPNNNKAFERAQDFDDLKTVKRKLKGDLIFVVPDAKAADMARQRQFPVYATLEDYIESLREDGADAAAGSGNPDAVKTTPEKRGRLFGNNRRSAAADAAGAAALGGAALGAAEARGAARRNVRTNPGTAYDQFEAPDEQEASSEINTPLPQHGSNSAPAARQPIIPATPKSNMLDDDDDALDAPGPASSTGRRGYIPADKQRQRGRSAPLAGVPVDEDDEDEAWEPIGPSAAAGAAGGAIAGAAAARSGVPSTPFFNHPNGGSAANAGEDASDIIDLQPVARGHGNGPRSTLKLNEGATPRAAGIAGTMPDDAVQPLDPPTRRRRTGSMATAAAGGALAAGALAAGAAGTANTHTPGAAPAGSAPGIAGRPVPGALPSRRTQPPRRRPSRGRVLLLLLLLLLLTAIVATVAWAGLSPASFQATVTSPIGRMFAAVAPATPATVTITPASKTEANSFVVHAVTTNPDPANLEVSMRNLTANPPAQTKTVRGTGTAHTPATEANGLITFYSTLSAEDFTAGIVFNVNGVHVVTEQPVHIPAPQLPVAGSYTVRAHVTTAGTVGNLNAGAISQACCGVQGVTAVSKAFSGGQDPVAYTYVQQSDVDGVVNPLVNALAQQAKTSFNQQLHANERLAGNPVCTQNTDVPKNQIGPQGSGISSVQVTVSASCTGVVYDYQGAQSVTQQRLQAQATRDLGANYKLIGNVVPVVKSVTQQGNSVTMLTNANGVWVYQFSDSQKQYLAKLLAGKKLADAKSLLAQQTGVQASDIKLNSGDTFPTDPSQITIDIKSVAGLSSGAGNGGTPPVSQPAAPGSTPEAGNGMLLPFFAQVEKFLKG